MKLSELQKAKSILEEIDSNVERRQFVGDIPLVFLKNNKPQTANDLGLSPEEFEQLTSRMQFAATEWFDDRTHDLAQKLRELGIDVDDEIDNDEIDQAAE